MAPDAPPLPRGPRCRAAIPGIPITMPLESVAAASSGAGRLDALPHGSEHLVRCILDAVPARVVVMDADERVVYANQEFFNFTRLHPRQGLGQPISRLISQAAYASYTPLRERINHNDTVAWQGWSELADVGRRYMREHLLPFGRAGDRPAALIAIRLDVTDSKSRGAELSSKVQQLGASDPIESAIVAAAVAALVCADDLGDINELNPAAESMFGLRRDAVLGRPVADIVVPERFRDAIGAALDRLASGALLRLGGRCIEFPARRGDGSEFRVAMRLCRTEAAGQTYYTAGIFDQTRARAAQQEIARQREALRHSEKLAAMGSLLAGIAQELNNPLTIVLGGASLLEERLTGRTGQADARRVRDAAQRCGRIVKALVTMARQRPPRRIELNLNDLVLAAVDLLHPGLRSHGIELVTALAADLPHVHADEAQLDQVVLNLLVNAQQALSAIEGPRRIHLTTGCEPGADGRPTATLRIVDNGPGVANDQRERIFEPFVSTWLEGGGYGLGLSVSRSMAREQGGDLVLERGDGGTVFRLTLPLEAPPYEMSPPRGTSGGDADSDVAPIPRLLVVDDEADIAEMMGEFLTSAGYAATIATSSSDALALLRSQRFDGVVSDLRMPEVDGATLWRTASARDPGLARRFLFVAGDTLSVQAQRFLQETGCPGLDKPFAKPEFVASVRSMLARSLGTPAPGPTRWPAPGSI